MGEKYIEKHYPNHSVFEEHATRTKKAGIGVYLFFGAIFAGCIYGIILGVTLLLLAAVGIFLVVLFT